MSCSVQAGNNRLSFTDLCRLSVVITHWSARCLPVAVLNCWRPIVYCGWCSIIEQFATWYCCVRHTVTFPLWTQNIWI